MSDTPPDRTGSTTPVNEQDPPGAGVESDPSSLSPAGPAATAETESEAVPSTPPAPVNGTDVAEDQLPLEPLAQGTAEAPAPGSEAPSVPVADATTTAEAASPEPQSAQPADAEPASYEPIAAQPADAQPAAAQPAAAQPPSPEPASPEPAAGAGAGTPVPQGPPAAPDSARPVFDPAPPPPRDDAPAEAAAATAPDVPPTERQPAPVPVPAAGDEAAAEPQMEEGAEPASSARSSLARRWPLVVLPLVVIAVVVAAFAVKSNTDKVADKVKPTAAFVNFADKEKGFSIKYPAKWKRVGRPNDEVRLLVKDEGLDSLLVRVVPTPAPFPADLTGEEAKQVADVVLKRETFAPERILREQPVNVNGAPGYYYLYTFDEEVKGQGAPQKVQGVHAHYIVFSGRRVFILVFQALPTANFDKLAPTFDAMAESFKITPLASDAPDPTTAPNPSVPPTEQPPAPAPASTETSAPPAGR